MSIQQKPKNLWRLALATTIIAAVFGTVGELRYRWANETGKIDPTCPDWTFSGEKSAQGVPGRDGQAPVLRCPHVGRRCHQLCYLP